MYQNLSVIIKDLNLITYIKESTFSGKVKSEPVTLLRTGGYRLQIAPFIKNL